jgi:hypothetical protein
VLVMPNIVPTEPIAASPVAVSSRPTPGPDR